MLIALCGSASCVVPVEVPQPPDPDGGSVTDDAGAADDAGASRDAGVDAGVPPTACSVPEGLGLFLARTTTRFVFPGCATATFSSEPGVKVETTRNADGSATVAITPSTLGAWVLTLDANGTTQTRELLTDEVIDLDAGFVRRYPDRVDGALTVTPSGRLLTFFSQEQIAVHGLDGGLEQTIAATSPIAWAGDAIWALRPQTSLVERWVDTPAGLVSTGTVDVTGHSYCLFCRVDQNQFTSMIGYDLVAFTWDGGAPSRRVVAGGLELPRAFNMLVQEGPDRVWADDLCSYEPGCTSTVCGAIQTCVRSDSSLLYANDQHALIYNHSSGGAIQLWEWPPSTRRELHGREAPGGYARSNADLILLAGREVVIHRNRIAFRYIGFQTLITRHWVVLFNSPRELRFIPR